MKSVNRNFFIPNILSFSDNKMFENNLYGGNISILYYFYVKLGLSLKKNISEQIFLTLMSLIVYIWKIEVIRFFFLALFYTAYLLVHLISNNVDSVDIGAAPNDWIKVIILIQEFVYKLWSKWENSYIILISCTKRKGKVYDDHQACNSFNEPLTLCFMHVVFQNARDCSGV